MMNKRNLLWQVFSFVLLATPLAYGSDQVNSDTTPGPLADTHEGLAPQNGNSDENFNLKEEMEDPVSAKKGKKKKKK